MPKLGSEQWLFALLSAVLAVAILSVDYPLHNYGFLIKVDDDGYVYENTHVLHGLQPAEIKWAFTHSYCLNYDPVTFLAHSANVRLFGLNGGRHHDANVLFHIVNALLLFWVLRGSTGALWRSFMVAGFFAVHPMNVENVAWISELKTLLATTFFFLALGAYHWYTGKPRLWRMLAVCFFYGLGLLSKPQIITLPFVLLLWDYWPLQRFPEAESSTWLDRFRKVSFLRGNLAALIAEKMPLFMVGAADVGLTLKAGSKPWVERYTLLIRFGTAIRSYAVYLGKAIWPVHLALNYPHPGYGLRWAEVWAAALLLIAISALVVACRKRRYLLVGWLWFLGVMIPTINLVQIDLAAFADRYAYISYVGLFLMVCWGLADLAQQKHWPSAALPSLGAASLLVLSAVTHHQVQYWSDPVTLWNHTLDVTQHNSRVDYQLGMILIRRGNAEAGLSHLYRALEVEPNNVALLVDTAETEHLQDHLRQAIVHYEKALSLSKSPSLNAMLYANLGHAYGDLGFPTKALMCYRESQRLKPTPPGFQ